ncbi:hypothetical protein KTN05_16795 [Paracoccus sp. Z118]|uniref:hypothetical protein n=1 Tax=Paracoccus sp. Z118 TaxID=2851017 RepID=UPI001C2C34A0|nr:hypothetical protein [Paracoccus sp. Z118]MBV0893460.1 hypothetical protein [Paracoccus sp. Z118]
MSDNTGNRNPPSAYIKETNRPPRGMTIIVKTYHHHDPAIITARDFPLAPLARLTIGTKMHLMMTTIVI